MQGKWKTDRNGNLTENDLWQFTHRGSPGQPISWHLIHPLDQERVRRSFLSAEARRRDWQSRYRIKLSFGVVYVSMTATPRFINGELDGYDGTWAFDRDGLAEVAGSFIAIHHAQDNE